MRLFVSCYYKGTNYAGWQRQPNALSVQEVIERELSKYFSNTPITIYGAGRTDAGVHAFGQKFHFDIPDQKLDIDRLLYSINQMLPPDIKIDDIEEVENDFHSRYSAKSKTYSYCILQDSKDPFLYETVYLHPEKIDVEKLREVLTHFVGVHNFKNFTSKEEDQSNFLREIFSITVSESAGLIYILLKGNGFMRYMIRFIVGTALFVTEKGLPAETIDSLLDENSPREIVSHKAPANGLTLIDVEY